VQSSGFDPRPRFGAKVLIYSLSLFPKLDCFTSVKIVKNLLHVLIVLLLGQTAV